MSVQLDMQISYRTSPEAMESTLGGETVLLHLGSGVYFGLDAVGTVVWQLLGEGLTPAAICDRVAAEFDAVPKNVDEDIRAFLEQLVERELIAPA